MAAARVDITIEQGATYTREIIWQDSAGVVIPLTNYEARMKIRAAYDSPAALVSLTSSPAAGLTITPAAGKIVIRISAVITDALAAGSGVYDLEIYKPADLTEVTRLIQGVVTITPQATY